MQSVVRLLAILCCLGRLDAGTFLLSMSKGSGTTAASTTLYGGLWSGGTGMTASGANSSSEGDVKMCWQIAGTFSKMQLYLSSNATSATSTLTFRKSSTYAGSSSDGNQSITVNAAQTGAVDEATNGSYHTDHVNAGDCVNIRWVTGAGGTSSLRWYEILFTPDDASKTLTKFGGYTAASFTSAGNYMQSLGGTPQNNGSKAESALAFEFRTGGTWQNICFNVTANTFSTASTITSRINTADGSQTVSIPASTTGQYCTTGTDTISDGSLAAVRFQEGNGGGSGSITISGFSSEFVTTDNTAMLVVQQSTSGSSIGTSATNYMTPNGDGQVNSTQGVYALDLRTTMTLSNMGVYPVTNTITASSTAGLWKNNATTLNLTVSIASSTSGSWLHDNTHTDSIVAGDTVEYKITTGASGTALAMQSLAIKATVPATSTATNYAHKGRIM